jgi:WD40 repeat protein
LDVPSAVTALAALPDGRAWLMGYRDGRIALVDRSTGRETVEFRSPGRPTAHGGPVQAVTVTRDGRLFSTTLRSARQWDPTTTPGEELLHFTIPPNRWMGVGFLPKGLQLLACDGEGQVMLWNLAERQPDYMLLLPEGAGLMWAVAAAGRPPRLVAGGETGALYIWLLPENSGAGMK